MEPKFVLGLRSILIGSIIALLMGCVETIAEEQGRQPILIPGIHEPEEMRVGPVAFKKFEPTAPERELAEATNNFSKLNDLPSVLPALDRILAKYPDFADGYVFRLPARCESKDLRGAISDITSALKFMGNSRSLSGTSGSLLSMQAKLAYANGDYTGAMDVLEKAIRADLEGATQFTNSGEVKPEKTASMCVWSETDMDALVQRFPNDYRSHMFRGLYFSKFAPLDEGSVSPAIESLNKATQLNSKSALPLLFKARLLGDHFVFFERLNKLGWADAARDKLDLEVVGEYDKALSLDPNLLPALKGRALGYFHLKRYPSAIADYDRILSIDAQDASTYHDRGLAKMLLRRDQEAIADLSAGIDIKTKDGSLESRNSVSHFYETRGEAYVKTRQWDRAIRDFTAAISIQVGNSVLLSNIDQFRAIYPEYAKASNDAVAGKLQQTFYPNFKYEDFAKGFFTHAAMPSTVIPDLYLKRSDAYVAKGNWHWASIEFQRAARGFPSYADAIERWRDIGQTGSMKSYIDMKTFDDAHRESVKLWLKQTRVASEAATGPFTLQRFELNCGMSQMRLVSVANYDASGEFAGNGSGGGARWNIIVPETLGETLHNGACRGDL
jgi:tetratricopeptide (TPR) repeat protein